MPLLFLIDESNSSLHLHILSREIRSVLLFCSWCFTRFRNEGKTTHKDRECENGNLIVSCWPADVLPQLCASWSTRISGSSKMRLVGWLVSFLAMMGARQGRSRSPVDRPWPEATLQAQGDEAEARRRGDGGNGEAAARAFARSRFLPFLAALAAVGGTAGSVGRLLAQLPNPNRLDPTCARGVTADADAALHHVSGSRPSQSQAGSRRHGQPWWPPTTDPRGRGDARAPPAISRG